MTTITKKQKEVFDYIVSYSDSNGYSPTQKEIKEHFGLKSFGSVQRYIKYLVDAGYLEGDWNARRGLKAKTILETPGFDSIPLLGKVAAGNPIEAIENPDETISVPLHMLKTGNRYFALKVVGDSMIEDGIFEDDMAICRYCPTANQGETVVAIIDGEATIKKFYKLKNKVELRPANAALSPILVDSPNFLIAGILVGLFRSYE